MKDFLWALSFLTVVPVNRKWYADRPDIRKVLFWFPVVGLVIGLFLAAFYYVAVYFFPFSVVDAVVLVVYFFITGGLHLDGFADTCDGIYGGKDKESRLRIMRDSAVGSFGASGLICLIGIKYLTFHSICNNNSINSQFFKTLTHILPSISSEQCNIFQKCIILFMMPLIGRWVQTFVASISKYARDGEGGTGLLIVQESRLKHTLYAAIVPVCFIYYFCGLRGIIAFFAIILFSLFYLRFIKSKIGGVTGDILGFFNEMSELVFVGAFLL